MSGRENRISNKTVQWMVQKYLRMAGFAAKGLSVHKLRHTAATLMYQYGKTDVRVLKDIQKLFLPLLMQDDYIFTLNIISVVMRILPQAVNGLNLG